MSDRQLESILNVLATQDVVFIICLGMYWQRKILFLDVLGSLICNNEYNRYNFRRIEHYSLC